LEPDVLATLFTGLLLVFRAGVRSRHKAAEMKQDVEQDLKMPAELAQLLVTAIQNKRGVVENVTVEKRPRCASLKSLDWRVEVTISTGSLNRVLKPSILLGMQMDNGETLTFEVSREKFQELRYQVASALKTTQTVEANPILKIE
jgi:hypothetical protein